MMWVGSPWQSGNFESGLGTANTKPRFWFWALSIEHPWVFAWAMRYSSVVFMAHIFLSADSLAANCSTATRLWEDTGNDVCAWYTVYWYIQVHVYVCSVCWSIFDCVYVWVVMYVCVRVHVGPYMCGYVGEEGGMTCVYMCVCMCVCVRVCVCAQNSKW